jgi:hypothetical protein
MFDGISPPSGELKKFIYKNGFSFSLCSYLRMLLRASTTTEALWSFQ